MAESPAWRTVPVEPTPEMLNAAVPSLARGTRIGACAAARGRAAKAYRAMLAAAPVQARQGLPAWPRDAEDRVNDLMGQLMKKELERMRLDEEVRRLSHAAPAARDPLPDLLFDGFAVLQALTPAARARTGADQVSDVLDAVVRLLRGTAAGEKGGE